jgi:hypothetical protein
LGESVGDDAVAAGPSKLGLAVIELGEDLDYLLDPVFTHRLSPTLQSGRRPSTGKEDVATFAECTKQLRRQTVSHHRLTVNRKKIFLASSIRSAHYKKA